MNFTGIITGGSVFLMIGIFHPIVIKAEYYYGTKCWPIFVLVGLLTLIGSILISSTVWSVLLGSFAFSCFWSILELFEQKKRVEKGWFPKNPNRPY